MNLHFLKLITRPIYLKIPVIMRTKISRRLANPYGVLEDTNKVIFIHIPKAAGNGLTSSLFGLPSNGHYFWRDYARNKEKFMNYYKFTVVRNPYARFYSAFTYLSSGGFGDYDHEFYLKYIAGASLEDFCERLIEDKCYRRKILNWIHFIPQVSYIYSADQKMVDDIYKLEDMKRDYNFIASRFSSADSCMKTVNKTKGEKVDIPAIMYECVNLLYARDFSLLEYDRV